MNAPIPDAYQPSPCGLSRKAIEQVAEAFARHYQYERKNSGTDDLAELVRKVGGKLEVGIKQSDGEITIEKDGSFILKVSPYTSWRRDRFTIAHELGHYVLHARNGEVTRNGSAPPFTIYREGSNQLETEANMFAAALLMPEGEFREQHSKAPDVASLAGHFGVSFNAVEVRLKTLGLNV